MKKIQQSKEIEINVGMMLRGTTEGKTSTEDFLT